MVKNRKLSRAISLQGWRQFRSLCEGKSEKLGRDFDVISRWEPTSQVCSECGYRWGKLDLKVRTVKCLNCGTEHDRDENAAKNINKVGIGHCHDSKRTQRQSKTTSVASVSEVSRITVSLERWVCQDQNRPIPIDDPASDILTQQARSDPCSAYLRFLEI
jgi:putative transposase